METYLFYILPVVTVLATIFAICEQHPVHAIVYLVTSFFALAAIFYLLSAPLVAMFEIIIYAGAVMVLFLFVVMILDLGHPEKTERPSLFHWLPAVLLTETILMSLGLMLSVQSGAPMNVPVVSVQDFAVTLFSRYGVAIEIISMQLLFAVVGALYLGRRRTS
ncbi:MAG: NADH-quinone oxidoreductase subunit J [Geobacteraceae bacterium]|nr:NADH-quinone oxidoreductase subunit J [Geobacteraceae bacterium]